MKLSSLIVLLILSLAAPLLHANTVTYLPSTASASVQTPPDPVLSDSGTLNDPSLFGPFQRLEIATNGAAATINTTLNPSGDPLIQVNNEFVFPISLAAQTFATSDIYFTLDNPALAYIDGSYIARSAQLDVENQTSFFDATHSTPLYIFSNGAHLSESLTSPTFLLLPGITYEWATNDSATNPLSSPDTSSSINYSLHLDFLPAPEPTSLLFLTASLPLLLRRYK